MKKRMIKTYIRNNVMNQYADIMANVCEGYIDFRSDTVTRPGDEMKRAILDCELGDDVYGEDPTVNALEKKMSRMLDKEAALFLPSGTMSNLVSLLSHCKRGEEVIVGDQYHIYDAEARGASVLGGISLNPIKTDKFGVVKLKDIIAAIKPDDNHYPITKLVCLENTVSGCVQNQADMNEIAIAVKDKGLNVHLDGARLFNAAIAQNVNVGDLTKNFDTVSICLSKGIGAPAGSVLVGPKEFVKYARRQRKLLGGGMRQAGILAACCLYGLEYNVPLLKHDHQKARSLAEELSTIEALSIDLDLVQTNMLFINPGEDAASLSAFLYERKILIGSTGTVRMVVHLDISESDIEKTIIAFKEFYRN
jgi:threonine aldolase